jgi:hypothetical protein
MFKGRNIMAENENKDTNTDNIDYQSLISKITAENDKNVKTFNAENLKHRIRADEYKGKIKDILGLDEKSDFGRKDIDAMISIWKTQKDLELTEAITKTKSETLSVANQRLISAAIKTVGNDYDITLLEAVIDKIPTKITVDDDGNIQGLQEALTEAITKFPKIKNSNSTVIQPINSGVDTSGTSKEIGKMTMDEYMQEFIKRKK